MDGDECSACLGKQAVRRVRGTRVVEDFVLVVRIDDGLATFTKNICRLFQDWLSRHISSTSNRESRQLGTLTVNQGVKMVYTSSIEHQHRQKSTVHI